MFTVDSTWVYHLIRIRISLDFWILPFPIIFGCGYAPIVDYIVLFSHFIGKDSEKDGIISNGAEQFVNVCK